jgi:hypothetical protein
MGQQGNVEGRALRSIVHNTRLKVTASTGWLQREAFMQPVQWNVGIMLRHALPVEHAENNEVVQVR